MLNVVLIFEGWSWKVVRSNKHVQQQSSQEIEPTLRQVLNGMYTAENMMTDSNK